MHRLATAGHTAVLPSINVAAVSSHSNKTLYIIIIIHTILCSLTHHIQNFRVSFPASRGDMDINPMNWCPESARYNPLISRLRGRVAHTAQTNRPACRFRRQGMEDMMNDMRNNPPAGPGGPNGFDEKYDPSLSSSTGLPD